MIESFISISLVVIMRRNKGVLHEEKILFIEQDFIS